MNLRHKAEEWLAHNLNEHSVHLKNQLYELLLEVSRHDSFFIDDECPVYDESFGNDKLCKCGHTYYRHFDTYEDMSPIGCKYCNCDKYDLYKCNCFEKYRNDNRHMPDCKIK